MMSQRRFPFGTAVVTLAGVALIALCLVSTARAADRMVIGEEFTALG
jgi:hypothetical protein